MMARYQKPSIPDTVRDLLLAYRAMVAETSSQSWSKDAPDGAGCIMPDPHVGFLKEYWAGDMAGDQSRQMSCSGYTPEPRHVSCGRSMDEPVAFLHDMPGFQYLMINVY